MWSLAGPAATFYSWGRTRWRQREDHRQARYRQEFRGEYPISWAGSCLGSKSESRSYLVILGIEKGSSPTRGQLAGSKANLPRDTLPCSGTPCPAQGHGLCGPAVISLPPGERMQQTVSV